MRYQQQVNSLAPLEKVKRTVDDKLNISILKNMLHVETNIHAQTYIAVDGYKYFAFMLLVVLFFIVNDAGLRTIMYNE